MDLTRQTLNQNLVERVAMGDMLRRRARDARDQEALVDFIGGTRRSLTYGEFNRQVNQLAHGFRQQGLKQGDRLALLMTNRNEFMVTTFACFKAGIVVVPLNFQQRPEDICFALTFGHITAILYEQAFANLTQASLIQASLTENTQPLCQIYLGETAPPDNLSYQELVTGQKTDEIEDIVIRDRDAAQMMFTSGTTSHPKAVETSHLALYISSLGSPISLRFTPGDSQLIVLPMFHCAALSLCFATLQIGGALVLQAAFDPVTVTDILEGERVNGAAMLPMMWKSLLQIPNITDRDFSAFKSAIYAMAPMDSPSLERLKTVFGCDFHLGSGQTEFSPPATLFYGGSDNEFGEGNYWGVPTIATEQALLDEQGREVPPGHIGEICWRGPQAMTCYVNNPDASAAASAFGWHHTGDLGMIDQKGQLLFVDRKKDMIKSGGENIASCKVEQILLGVPGVTGAAVFGVPHPHWIEAVCAAVVIAPDTPQDEDVILDHCKQMLAGFEVPKKIIFTEQLPLTGTGKVQKQVLRQKHARLFE